MYLVTLTRYEPNGIYADPYNMFKWVEEDEDKVNQFVEKVANLLDMEESIGDTWTKEILMNEELSLYYELILEVEEVDTIQSDDLKETLKDYIVNPEYL